ncbi:uncharacterized, partial [Tachysurus ichikawai]
RMRISENGSRGPFTSQHHGAEKSEQQRKLSVQKWVKYLGIRVR